MKYTVETNGKSYTETLEVDGRRYTKSGFNQNLEEIKRIEDEYCHDVHSSMFCMGVCSMAADVKEIIYSHLEEISNDGWILVSDRLPEDCETVLCTDGEDIFLVEYDADLDAGFGDMDWIIAWQPLPEPYKGGE